MAEPIFESVTTMDQAEFAPWVRDRARWDPNDYELLGGRVVMSPPAGWPHGRVEADIARLLGNFVEQAGSGIVLGSSQGYELPTGDTLAPDASFVSHARWAAAPEPQFGEFLRVVPDLVVEVLSRSTAARDHGEKKAAYARAGVREYWIVDPIGRSITVFVSLGERFDQGRVLREHDELTSTVLVGLVLAARELL